MIAHIEGTLGDVWGNSCIVLTCSGVGYRLLLPAHTCAALPQKGEQVAFYTSMSVRENAIELYGFTTLAERATFEILRALNKIGPRSALAILSACRPDELGKMVATEDLAAFTRIPGIGKKTAQHILLELKSKLPGTCDIPQSMSKPTGLYADVMAALANLGYTESECAGIVGAIIQAEPDLDPGSAIRLALKELGKS